MPTFRAAVANNTVSGSPSNGPNAGVPTGVQNGDLLLATVTFEGGTNQAITAPSGWTQLASGGREDNGTTVSQCTYYKIANNESGTYTWTLSSSALWAVVIRAYYGTDPNNPVNASGGQANGSSTTVTAPSVTTTVNGCTLVFLGATDAKVTWTAPSGYGNAETSAGAQQPGLGTWDASQSTAGSTGSVAATDTLAGANSGVLVALAPPQSMSGLHGLSGLSGLPATAWLT